ncbi:MAG TPA: HDIG domain-containing protein [Herpetosiphonaceae bacterium]
MEGLTLPAEHRPVLAPIQTFLAERGCESWLVGGYVRDLLRGRPSGDIDIAVDGAALKLARELADRTGGAFVPLHDETDTARIVWKSAPAVPTVVDLVRLRAPSIEGDLRLRDLTINALALPLNEALTAVDLRGLLLDPTQGQRDLLRRQIRPCGPTALTDDPLRMLRAARFAAQFGFALAPETDAALREHAHRIDKIAQERIRDELLKLLAARHAAPWLAYLDEVRLLTRIIPELDAARDCAQPSQHFLPVLAHLFETVCVWEWLYAQFAPTNDDAPHWGAAEGIMPTAFVEPVSVKTEPRLAMTQRFAPLIRERMTQEVTSGHRRYAVFKLAALLHDVAKPLTMQIRDERITFYGHEDVGADLVRQIGQRLRLGREATSYAERVVREHMRPGQLHALGSELTRRAIYRLLRDTGAAAPDVLLHSLCDHLAAKGPRATLAGWQHHVAWTESILGDVRTERPVVPKTQIVTGGDVIHHLEIEPGPIVGRILAAIDEALFLGEVTTREEALALAAQIAHADEERRG